MDKRIKRHIEGASFCNAMYELSETEKDSIAEIKELLNEDHGFYDIVLDFSDYCKMQDMINSVPDDKYKDIRLVEIANKYLMFKIVKAANIDLYRLISKRIKSDYIDFYSDCSLEECEKKLFSDNFAELYKICIPYNFDELANIIKEKARTTTTGIARMHLFLDDVNDVYLQKQINYLYTYTSRILMMGYKTHDLITHLNTFDHLIQPPYDFSVFESEKKRLEENEEVDEKIKKLGGII